MFPKTRIYYVCWSITNATAYTNIITQFNIKVKCYFHFRSNNHVFLQDC